MVSLGETQVRPTAMLWRNMAAMATEEMLRANPIDGVVLLGGCDKTIPALLMAAASVDLPAVVVPGGPMLTGTFRGVPLGCGTDVWRLSEEVRAGTLSEEEFHALRVVDDPQPRALQHDGHRVDHGRCVAEALGMTLPGVAGTPAPDSRLLEAAHATGRLAVELVAADRRPSTVLTRGSFLNAIVALAAIGGSTNAVVHLLAIAGRLGVELTLDDFDRIGSRRAAARRPAAGRPVPDGRPAPRRRPARGAARGPRPARPDARSPSPAGRWSTTSTTPQSGTARSSGPRAEPLQPHAGIAVLRGNLAPDGAVIKPAAASPQLLHHRGRAVVFDTIEDLHARIDDPDLDVDADSVLVLRGCGPKGYPGMPEVAEPAAADEAARSRASATWCGSATAG